MDYTIEGKRGTAVIWTTQGSGPDNLKPIVLQHLPIKAIEALTRIYMVVVDTGYTPRRWRESNVMFLAKPGKTDMADPRSFRTISLMSFVYKGLEKVVSMHLDETTW
jgi:hypothetical protein